MHCRRLWLALLACSYLSSSVLGAEPAAPAPEMADDVPSLVAAGLATDGPALLEFFRARTRLDNDAKRLLALTRQLGNPDARISDSAAAELIARGPAAIPALRLAINDGDDAARAARARRCLQRIEGSEGAALVAAAARLVGKRRPAGAAPVLLAYLPLADDEAVIGAVREALTTLAYQDGKVDAALSAALNDSVALRRAIAVEVLCGNAHPELWPALRKLHRDPNLIVRFRAALALVRVSDVESIPVLIELLADLPPAARTEAESALEELAGEWAPHLAMTSETEAGRRLHRDAWAAWWRNTDGPALLAEFRKRTLSDADLARIQMLIKNLADDSFEVREKASAGLVASGSPCVPRLREATKDADRERARRAQRCLVEIEKAEDRRLPLTAARLLALRKPEGAVEVLLAYLANADDEGMAQEIATALAALAIHNDGPHPALLAALSARQPVQRAAAAVALTRTGSPECRPAIRKLLRDDHAEVRLSAALALVAAGEKEAVAVLITALADTPLDQAAKAHETLCRLAGSRGPALSFAGDTAARQKCRDAWKQWWAKHSTSVDFALLREAPRLLGYTLIVEADDNGAGRVFELGRDGRTRWQIDGIQGPMDAHILPGHRVLIAEFNACRVTERDFKGNIIWKKENLRGNPSNVQRLANGNTFIATTLEVLEVDPTGKEVFSHRVQNTGLYGAGKTRNGDIYCFLAGGTCVRLDAAGKELKSFPSGRASFIAGGIDVLPTGRIWITQPNQNAIVEVDAEGTSHWRLDVPGVSAATWLGNGHILAACADARKVVELDRNGKVLWEYQDGKRIFRARRR